MQTIILAGGFGTRLAEETNIKPKPMVKIDEYPILWHIIQIYFKQGHNDFIIAGGYKKEIIVDWFQESGMFKLTYDSFAENHIFEAMDFSMRIQILDTGAYTNTSQRLLKCLDLVTKDNFFLTYGDGVGNINLENLMRKNRENNCLVTVTAVHPPARFGLLSIDSSDQVQAFSEKSQELSKDWINGGFMVANKEIINYMKESDVSLEFSVLPKLASEGKLNAYKHEGFWMPMDTARERDKLRELVGQSQTPPWHNL